MQFWEKTKIMPVLRRLKKLVARFQEKNIFTLAAAVSFYAFLSLFPFFILVVSVSSILFQKTEVLEKIQNYLRIFPPSVSETIMGNLSSLVESRQFLGIISILFLVYFAFRVFSGLEQALKAIFGGIAVRNSWMGRVYAFVFFVCTAFTLLLMFISGGAFLFVAAKLEKIPLVSSYLVILAGDILVVSFFFALTYRYLSEKKIRLKKAWCGGLVASVLWEVLKHVFGIYIASLTRTTLIYGSIGSVIMLQLWLYYSVLIFLVGAELSLDIS